MLSSRLGGRAEDGNHGCERAGLGHGEPSGWPASSWLGECGVQVVPVTLQFKPRHADPCPVLRSPQCPSGLSPPGSFPWVSSGLGGWRVPEWPLRVPLVWASSSGNGFLCYENMGNARFFSPQPFVIRDPGPVGFWDENFLVHHLCSSECAWGGRQWEGPPPWACPRPVSPRPTRAAGAWHPSTQGRLCWGPDAAGWSLRRAQAGLWSSAICSPCILCSDSAGVWVCVTAPRLHVSGEEETPS